jgi:hypothetical protein
MRRYAFGKAKPIYVDVNGHLQWEVSHLRRAQAFEHATIRLRDYGARFRLAGYFSRFMTLCYRRYQSFVEPKTFTDAAMDDKAAKILFHAEDLAESRHFSLLIVSGIDGFCARHAWKLAVCQTVHTKEKLITRLGENLRHMSADENRRFAEAILPNVKRMLKP